MHSSRGETSMKSVEGRLKQGKYAEEETEEEQN